MAARWRLVFLSTTTAFIAGLVWVGCSPDSADLTAPDDRLAVLQELLGPAMQVQERHTPELMELPGVVGTAVGLTGAGDPVLKIMTTRPGVAGLPDRLDGFPVAVEVTGLIMARTDPTVRQPRPVPTGVSIGHPAITAGTIAARVKDVLGNVYILSNNHVLADANDAELGDPIVQPGAYDGGQSPGDVIGQLDSFEWIDFNGGNNTMDAAIAISSTADLGNSTPTDDGYGTPSSEIYGDGDGDGYFDNKIDLLNLAVQKYGRTTKLTQGTVTEINATISVCYEALYGIFCLKSATFVDQIGISPGKFSGGGDSGSLIVDLLGNKPVGLLFAGSSTRTFANRIDLVLKNFGVIVDGDAPVSVTDIGLTDISAPESVTQGDPVNVEVTIRNVGNEDVTDDIEVTLTDEADGGLIGTQTIAGGLRPGNSTTLTYNWDTSGESIGDHTLTATHLFVDENAANDSRSTVVTVNDVAPPPPPPAEGMHIGDLWKMSTSEGRTWSAYVIVTVHDGSHNTLPNATVYGSWTGSGLGSDECTTDYAGECLMLKTLIRKRNSSVTFTVNNVVYASQTYQPGGNHDDDGDSDGTSITVPKQ